MNQQQERTNRVGEVWSSTWVPNPCPVDGFGSPDGYAVAWVQLADGPRVQALVGSDSPPPFGQRGLVVAHSIDDQLIDVFTADEDAR